MPGVPVPPLEVVRSIWPLLGREPEHFGSYVEDFGLEAVWRDDLFESIEHLYEARRALYDDLFRAEEENTRLRAAAGEQADAARKSRNQAAHQRKRAAKWQKRAEDAEGRLREAFGHDCVLNDEDYCEAHGMTEGCLEARCRYRRPASLEAE